APRWRRALAATRSFTAYSRKSWDAPPIATSQASEHASTTRRSSRTKFHIHFLNLAHKVQKVISQRAPDPSALGTLIVFDQQRIATGSTMKRPRLTLAASLVPSLCLVLFACTGGTDAHSPSQGGQGGAPPATVSAGQGGELAMTGGSGMMAGSAGVGGVGGVGGQVLGGLLLDDFEDGDDLPLIPGSWYGYADVDNGGLSTLSFVGAAAGKVAMNGPGFQSQKSLEVSYTFAKGTSTIDPYVGLGVSIGSDAAPYDLSSYTGVSYTYQCQAHRLEVLITDVKANDHFGLNLTASAAWKTVTIAFET